ncbi:glycosyltransferase family 2 protein [Faecalibaculum rodentium]|uniref:glycosyltransferase family 2 protein n=1 Tax=Faecalibaculum rodentium TaxID=1702221 RepID=UPI0023F594E5|nr:glycosyltransferase family 2 protein [Faecalibaculum rodentium]
MDKLDSGVSILIPTYNASEYINKTLKSVFDQSYQDYEVVIVDDGSTDKTLHNLKKWKEKYPEKIRIHTQQNSGVSETRNVLLSLAKKKYITFLDSDDYFDVDYLKTLVNAAEVNNSDMVISGQRKVTLQGDVITTIHYPVEQKQTTPMRRLNFAGKLYKRELILKNDICFQKGNLYEDNPFNLALITLSKNLVILPYEGYNQIVHIGSITTRKIEDNLVPMRALEETVKLVVKNKDKIADYDLFAYTTLSFFCFFIFKANKTHSYMKTGKGRISNVQTVLNFSRFIQNMIKKYPLEYKGNKYYNMKNTKDLPLSQRIGMILFVSLLRHSLLDTAIKFYYSFG